MSFYNMFNGVNISAFIIFPLILDYHPDDFPRFRDCFVDDDGKHVLVYSRMGGGNRRCWNLYETDDYGYQNGKCLCPGCKADEIEEHELFVSRIDDDFDSTYCTFKFKVPKKWENDFNLIKEGKIKDTSEEYKQKILKMFPKIKDKLEILFKGKDKK